MNETQAQGAMPLWQCHKKVRAIKIRSVEPYEGGVAQITAADGRSFCTSGGWTSRWKGTEADPGYYVRYDDGYESWSPTAAFESGYTQEAIDMSTDEQAIEQQIKAKGLTAPRITPQMIDAQIVSEAYHVFPGTTLTICCLTLQNGYHVTGESAAASPENFNPGIGATIAKKNAREKIWALEGYLLHHQLAGNNGPLVK